MHHRRWLGPPGAVGLLTLTPVLALALAAPARADTGERPSPWKANATRAGEVVVERARSSAEPRFGLGETSGEPSGECLVGTAPPDPLARFQTYGPAVFGLVCDVESTPATDVGCLGGTDGSQLPCPARVEAPIARAGTSGGDVPPGFEAMGTGGAAAPGGAMPAAAPVVPLVSGDASTAPVPPAGQTGEFAVSGLDDRMLAIALASVFLLAALAGLRLSRGEPATD